MRFSAALLLIALVACGGGDSGSPVQPGPGPGPNPPPAPVATTLAVHAGDNQTAPAGTSLPVNPAVVVRDQNGATMSGINVTFTVDSGGGRVEIGAATTRADGVATAGRWTLGMGRNRLRAAAGTLTPVSFTAIATGELTVADTTISTAGGTVQLTSAGDPLRGLRIDVPKDAYARALKLRVQYGDSSGAPSKAGMRRVSPVITVGTSETGYSRHALSLRIPTEGLRDDEWPVVLAFDRTTGAFDAFPTNRLDSGVVVTQSRHFNRAKVATATGRAFPSFRRDPLQDYAAQLQLAVYAVPLNVLAGDLDSGYRPHVDDWEFDFFPTDYRAYGGWSHGYAAASAAYYVGTKQVRGSLNGRYQQAKGIQGSNWRGIRLGVVVWQMADIALWVGEQATLFLTHLAGNQAGMPISEDSVALLNIKAGLFTTGYPQLLHADNGNSQAIPGSRFVMAYRTRGSAIDVTTGSNAKGINPPQSVRLLGGKWQPVLVGDQNHLTGGTSGPIAYQMLYPMGLTAGIDPDSMRTAWGDFFAGTVGNGRFADIEVVTLESRNVVDTLFLPDDTTRVWLECTKGCAWGWPAQGIPAQHPIATGFIATEQGGTWTESNQYVQGSGTRIRSQDDGRRIGFTVAVAGNSQLTIPVYNTWRELVVKAKRLVVTATPSPAVAQTDVVLHATYTRPMPPGVRQWKWELGDGRVLTTATDSVIVRYPTPSVPGKPYDVKVSLLVASTLEATGHASLPVTRPRWRLTSFIADSFANTLPVQPSHSTLAAVERNYRWEESDLRDSLLANPGAGILELLQAGDARPVPHFYAGYTWISYDWLLVMRESGSVPALYLRVPRGSANLTALLATTGVPTLAYGGAAIPRNPVPFTNQYTVTSTGPTTYSGRALNKALGNRTSVSAQPSQPMLMFEVNATTVPTGLSGTITMVFWFTCGEGDPAFLAQGCGAPIKEIRRTYRFTAVPF